MTEFECKECGSDEYVEKEESGNKIRSECSNCGKWIKWGRMEKKVIENGEYECRILLAEEIKEKFILFKFENKKFRLTKKIWKNEQGVYYYNLERFIRFFDDIPCNNLQELFDILKDKHVLISVENIVRNDISNAEVKCIKKLL